MHRLWNRLFIEGERDFYIGKGPKALRRVEDHILNGYGKVSGLWAGLAV